MKASIVDLRYKMKDILQALDRKESIEILYHGKIKGTLIPYSQNKKISIKKHPFFGMDKDDDTKITDKMQELRGNRYHDL